MRSSCRLGILSLLFGWGLFSLTAQERSGLPLHADLQLGTTVPVGAALSRPYRLGPQGQIGLSWLSPDATWLVQVMGGYATLRNRPAEAELTRYQSVGGWLRGGPGGRLAPQWQLHLLLSLGYAWSRDDLIRPGEEPRLYLTAQDWQAGLGLCLTWHNRWTLSLDGHYFNPPIQLGADIRQQLTRRGSLYDLFRIPSQRFAMHGMSLRLGLRL